MAADWQIDMAAAAVYEYRRSASEPDQSWGAWSTLPSEWQDEYREIVRTALAALDIESGDSVVARIEHSNAKEGDDS